MASLLTGRRLGVRVVGIGLVGFVMADDATGRCAELAMASHVPRDAADNGALDAAFRLHARGRSDCDRGREDRCEHPFHDCSPNAGNRRVNSIRKGAFLIAARQGDGLGLPSYDTTPATMVRRIANRPIPLRQARAILRGGSEPSMMSTFPSPNRAPVGSLKGFGVQERLLVGSVAWALQNGD